MNEVSEARPQVPRIDLASGLQTSSRSASRPASQISTLASAGSQAQTTVRLTPSSQLRDLPSWIPIPARSSPPRTPTRERSPLPSPAHSSVSCSRTAKSPKSSSVSGRAVTPPHSGGRGRAAKASPPPNGRAATPPSDGAHISRKEPRAKSRAPSRNPSHHARSHILPPESRVSPPPTGGRATATAPAAVHMAKQHAARDMASASAGGEEVEGDTLHTPRGESDQIGDGMGATRSLWVGDVDTGETEDDNNQVWDRVRRSRLRLGYAGWGRGWEEIGEGYREALAEQGTRNVCCTVQSVELCSLSLLCPTQVHGKARHASPHSTKARRPRGGVHGLYADSFAPGEFHEQKRVSGISKDIAWHRRGSMFGNGTEEHKEQEEAEEEEVSQRLRVAPPPPHPFPTPPHPRAPLSPPRTGWDEKGFPTPLHPGQSSLASLSQAQSPQPLPDHFPFPHSASPHPNHPTSHHPIWSCPTPPSLTQPRPVRPSQASST